VRRPRRAGWSAEWPLRSEVSGIVTSRGGIPLACVPIVGRGIGLALAVLVVATAPAAAQTTGSRIELVGRPTRIERTAERYQRRFGGLRLADVVAELRGHRVPRIVDWNPHDTRQDKRGRLYRVALRDGTALIARTERRQPLWMIPDVPPGTAAVRERATYLTALHLGFHRLVPPTWIGKLDGRTASLQVVVPVPPDPQFLHAPWESLLGTAILDFVVNQRDRRWYNLHFGQDKMTLALDNEAAFAPDDPSRDDPGIAIVTLGQRWADKGKPSLPRRIERRLARVNIAAWQEDLAELGLTPDEIAEATGRLVRLQQLGLAALPLR